MVISWNIQTENTSKRSQILGKPAKDGRSDFIPCDSIINKASLLNAYCYFGANSVSVFATYCLFYFHRNKCVSLGTSLLQRCTICWVL